MVSNTELRPGEVVGIVGETDDGLIRAVATVIEQTGDYWYTGELEDGSPVEFRIDQVEELLGGPAYELSGFMDWFKKKPKAEESKSLIPIDPQQVIYVSPSGVARYEESVPKRSFLTPIKEAVKSFFTSIPEKARATKQLFKGDIIPAPSQELAPHKKPSSLFAQFMPPEDALAPAIKKLEAIIPPEGPTPLAPYIEKAQEIFQHVQASPQPISEETRAQEKEALWAGMFQESKPEEALHTVFDEIVKPEKQKKQKRLERFPQEQVVTEETVQVPETVYEHGRSDIAIKPLPMLPRNSVFPTVEDIARGLIGFYAKQDRKGRYKEEFPNKFFKDFAEISKAFRKDEESAPITMEPFETIGLCDGHPDPFEGMSVFLQIPWEEFRRRAVIEETDEGEEEWTDVNAITEEIMMPAMQAIEDAFELIKPEGLPGRFMVSYSQDCGCLNMYYVDQKREFNDKERNLMDYYGYLPANYEESEEGLYVEAGEESEEEPEEEAPVKKKPKAKKKKKSGK